MRLILLPLVLLAACATPLPPAEPVARADFNAAARQVAAYAEAERRAAGAAGLSVALVDDQRVLWAGGFGVADAATRTPAGPDTVYRAGSISKLFTDTAAMQLVAAGKLDLDAPVQRTLPGFGLGDGITLRALMTHHAGLARDVDAGMWLQAAPLPERDFRAAVRALGPADTIAPPGLVFSYSNVALDVVGAMVEAASGRPFEAHLQQAVLAPLGMAGASFSAAPPAAAARGHFKGEPQAEPALRDVPAGGLNASVNDLARFISAQFAGGPAVQEMLRRQNVNVPLDADFAVGLGWMLSTFGTDTVKGGGPVAHHAGATMVHRAQLMLLPEQKLGVVVMSNDGAAAAAVNRIAQRALALLLEARSGVRQPPAEPGFRPATAPWKAEQRAACEGRYTTVAGPLLLRAEGDALKADLDGRTFDVLEGEDGRFGLRLRALGVVAIDLGALSQMGFECRRLQGRDVLLSVLDGQRLLVGERLGPPPPLPAGAWTGRWRPRLAPDEVPSLAGDVDVQAADGRLWASFTLHRAFGGARVRTLLEPVDGATVRAVGPLAGTGPLLRLEPGAAPRVRFSGWTFEKVKD